MKLYTKMDAFVKALQFREKYKEFFAAGCQLWLERMDNVIPNDPNAKIVMDIWIHQSPKHREFFEYHKKMTEPVFGKWNYDK